MIVVLDTNVVLQALNPRHTHAPIMDEWFSGRFVMAVSTDILMEYREVIVRRSGEARWNTLDHLIRLATDYRKTWFTSRLRFSSGLSRRTVMTTNSRTARSPLTRIGL
jgi:predicted nucleic acid-binding protein